jgi:hypothetical protein
MFFQLLSRITITAQRMQVFGFIRHRNSGMQRKWGKAPKMTKTLVATAEERLRSFKWEDRELLSHGLDLESQDVPVFLGVVLERWRVIDQNTFEVLAEHRYYSAFNKWGNYKRLIFARPSCSNMKNTTPSFAEIIEEFKRPG